MLTIHEGRMEVTIIVIGIIWLQYIVFFQQESKKELKGGL